MARWVAIFEDDPGAGAVRVDHRQAHFDYLERNADRIRLAGAVQPGPEENRVGALWILDVDSRDEAERLCEDDPFYRNGLRRGYRLLLWGRGPCYGELDTVPL